MSNKNKNTVTTSDKLRNISAQLGIVMMSAAATLGMMELPDHSRSQILIPSRVAFAFVGENSDPANTVRRERDESAPHYVSYSETQRTPSRSGR